MKSESLYLFNPLFGPEVRLAFSGIPGKIGHSVALVKTLKPDRLVYMSMFSKRIQLFLKRLFDVVVSGVMLLLLSPFFLIAAICVKLSSPGPVLFRQNRVGKNGNLFKLNKFRTMVTGAAAQGMGLSVQKNDARITRLGAFYRKMSIDELPQLLNVFLGDISFVGPRPTIPEHLKYYNDFHRKRLEVIPGITGLATVNGRASIPWSKRIEWDVTYVETFSLWLDLKILWKTVWVVLRGEGTYYDYSQGPAFDLASPDDQPREGESKVS